jgi:hypothetical protein
VKPPPVRLAKSHASIPPTAPPAASCHGPTPVAPGPSPPANGSRPNPAAACPPRRPAFLLQHHKAALGHPAAPSQLARTGHRCPANPVLGKGGGGHCRPALCALETPDLPAHMACSCKSCWWSCICNSLLDASVMPIPSIAPCSQPAKSPGSLHRATFTQDKQTYVGTKGAGARSRGLRQA